MTLPLLLPVAIAESGGGALAISPSGVLQLMRRTARARGVSDPFDPDQAASGAARPLNALLPRFDENPLAACNAGAGAVVQHGDAPPYAEARPICRRFWRSSRP